MGLSKLVNKVKKKINKPTLNKLNKLNKVKLNDINVPKLKPFKLGKGTPEENAPLSPGTQESIDQSMTSFATIRDNQRAARERKNKKRNGLVR